ncbi:MAG: response regulator transcription factor [Candidatus Symbiobacter sp.]|nr:response regulator transcription factor [Candidatus Symbiobacter sp.]
MNMTASQSRAHILIVDDDVRLAELIANYLGRQNFSASLAHSAQEARQALGVYRFDLLVMDVMMPGESGLDFVTAWRQEKADNTPILLLTALGESGDRIAGLEAGADDYLTKPFEPRELLLRIEAILRRQAMPPLAPEGGQKFIKLGALQFDPNTKRLWHDQTVIALTHSEAELLSILALNLAKPVSRQTIYDGIHCDGQFIRPLSLSEERAIDVAISRLRRKIETDSKQPVFLQTVHGKGYVLMPTH